MIDPHIDQNLIDALDEWEEHCSANENLFEAEDNMSGITGEQVLAAVAAAENGMEESIQPTIIANFNVDHSQVAEYWAGLYNDSWADTINQKLAEGFIAIRIQTEWQGAGSGHVTKIYMVKMK